MENHKRPCPICGGASVLENLQIVLTPLLVDCPRCGRFTYSTFAYVQLNALHQRQNLKETAMISGWVRGEFERSKINEGTDKPEQVIGLTTENYPMTPLIPIEHILAKAPTTIGARLDAGLLTLSNAHPNPGTRIPLGPNDCSIFYMQDVIGLRFSLHQMAHSGLIILYSLDHYPMNEIEDPYLRYDPICFIEITLAGWNKIADLQTVTSSPMPYQAFVAMSFDENLNEAYKEGISLGVTNAGFDPVRIDETLHPNRIDDEIMREIRRSAFVVADFTGHRAGVYFESGFALGLGKPVIWTCRKDEFGLTHFDTRSYPHIIWETKEILAAKLTAHINARIGLGKSRL